MKLEKLSLGTGINLALVEMNCFLCHTPNPDNGSRLDRLHAGDFKWANTATLDWKWSIGKYWQCLCMEPGCLQ